MFSHIFLIPAYILALLIVGITASTTKMTGQTQPLPAETMKAIVNTHFGAIDDVLRMDPTHPRCNLADSQPGEMLIKVLACSLSPGDNRNINGSASFIRKCQFPWIPGHDVCGEIVAIRDDDADAKQHFAPGDIIVTTSSQVLMKGGLAEYALVESAHAAKKPPNLRPAAAATLGSSAQRALQAVRQVKVGSGHRVLVLGGSGGFGSFVIPLLKAKGAFVVTTSTQDSFCRELGADRVLNYENYNEDDVSSQSQCCWWKMDEFRGTQKFDCIMDCEPDRKGNPLGWSLCHRVLKSRANGGFYLAVSMDDPDANMQSLGDVVGHMVPMLWRSIKSSIPFSGIPKYRLLLATPERSDLAEVMDLVDAGKLNVVFDEGSPFPFTQDGVLRAFHRVNSKHAHGKVSIVME